MRYFLYARKSTDVEDKQVMSIEGQLVELRALAKRDGLEIAEEFIEKRSAKIPGRPVFEDMLKRIEKDEAHGIICWKIDRLSRNPVDSGRISWLLQQNIIQKIVTHDKIYLPHDNVLLMSVEFGMANQYIRDLSVNVKRGLRQKARQGVYPSTAPLGYRNDPYTKTIVVDRRKAPLVRKAFELYAKNGSRLEDIAQFLFEHGIKTGATRGWSKGGGRPLKKDQITFLLSNPFYFGHFAYSGEMYEGTHTPIVSKELFDAVQKVLALRSRAHHKVANEPQAYCGLLHCGECGFSITAEEKSKRQKNGNVHRYIYYRCTKKKAAVHCSQPYVREEALDSQLSGLLAKFVMPAHWAKELDAMAERDAASASQTTAASVQAMRAKIAELDGKIARITDLFVEQDIERGDYLERKRALMSEKKSVQERILLLERDAAVWLEPMQKWIQEAQMLEEIAKSKDYPSKKSSLQKIFGSNLTLHAREARGVPQNQWFSLLTAKENHSENNLVPILVTSRGIEPRFHP
ncbi:MAG: recombinase [Parcubacteria group bacterium Gr01-1014_8]|nr:MAG: recombinase [Parcubacteria group bacterium Gr01-1014_8]